MITSLWNGQVPSFLFKEVDYILRSKKFRLCIYGRYSLICEQLFTDTRTIHSYTNNYSLIRTPFTRIRTAFTHVVSLPSIAIQSTLLRPASRVCSQAGLSFSPPTLTNRANSRSQYLGFALWHSAKTALPQGKSEILRSTICSIREGWWPGGPVCPAP